MLVNAASFTQALNTVDQTRRFQRRHFDRETLSGDGRAASSLRRREARDEFVLVAGIGQAARK